MRGLPDDVERGVRHARDDGGQRLDQQVEALVGPDQPEEEDARRDLLGSRVDGRAGVQQRVRDDGDPLRRDAADLDEQAVAAGRAVHDHAIAVGVELGPQRRGVARAPGSTSCAVNTVAPALLRAALQRPQIPGRRRRPLPVHDVGMPRAHVAHEPGEPGEVPGGLQRDARARRGAVRDQARERRAEQLAAHVAVGHRRLAVREVRRQQLDLGAGGRERPAELVVVGRREGLRIDDRDAHRHARRPPRARGARARACRPRRPCRRAPASRAPRAGPAGADDRGRPTGARRSALRRRSHGDRGWSRAASANR